MNKYYLININDDLEIRLRKKYCQLIETLIHKVYYFFFGEKN